MSAKVPKCMKGCISAHCYDSCMDAHALEDIPAAFDNICLLRLKRNCLGQSRALETLLRSEQI